MIIHRTDGGRRIDLFLPFKHGRRVIRSITLAPMTWDHTLKWQEGEYNKATDLLFDLAEQSEEIVRKVRYPDVDRVMTQFFDLLPPEIRESIAAGTIPKKVPVEEQTIPEPMVEAPVESQEQPAAETEKPHEEYQPYRMPTKEEVESDMKTHPPPENPFGHLKKDETGLGFEVS